MISMIRYEVVFYLLLLYNEDMLFCYRQRSSHMNNEEKILAILEKVEARLGNLESSVTSLETSVTNLETSVTNLEKGQATLTKEVKSLRRDVDKHLWGEITRLENRIDQHDEDITALKNATRS